MSGPCIDLDSNKPILKEQHFLAFGEISLWLFTRWYGAVHSHMIMALRLYNKMVTCFRDACWTIRMK